MRKAQGGGCSAALVAAVVSVGKFMSQTSQCLQGPSAASLATALQQCLGQRPDFLFGLLHKTNVLLFSVLTFQMYTKQIITRPISAARCMLRDFKGIIALGKEFLAGLSRTREHLP
jgi:hypothetical protein